MQKRQALRGSARDPAARLQRLTQERYPAAWLVVPASEPRRAVRLPEWTPGAFRRETNAWLDVAEACQASPLAEARRWGRYARHAVRRLRAELYRRADAPLWTVWGVLAAAQTLPEPAARRVQADVFDRLGPFLEEATGMVVADAWTRATVEALAVQIARHAPHQEEARLTAQFHAYRAHLADGQLPGPVPWVSAGPADGMEERRAAWVSAVPHPAPMTRDAVAAALQALGGGGLDEPATGSAEEVFRAGLVALWREQGHPELDWIVRDPGAVSGLVDWAVARAATLLGPAGAGFRWWQARREALVWADASLSWEGAEPEDVLRWLERFVDRGQAAACIQWLVAEPGWALRRRAFMASHGWDATTADRLDAVLATSPADGPDDALVADNPARLLPGVWTVVAANGSR